jgi:hypothetical protein
MPSATRRAAREATLASYAQPLTFEMPLWTWCLADNFGHNCNAISSGRFAPMSVMGPCRRSVDSRQRRQQTLAAFSWVVRLPSADVKRRARKGRQQHRIVNFGSWSAATAVGRSGPLLTLSDRDGLARRREKTFLARNALRGSITGPVAWPARWRQGVEMWAPRPRSRQAAAATSTRRR